MGLSLSQLKLRRRIWLKWFAWSVGIFMVSAPFLESTDHLSTVLREAAPNHQPTPQGNEAKSIQVPPGPPVHLAPGPPSTANPVALNTAS
jgi:hypothetical protein